MGTTTNILDMNNRISALEKGVTSVEDAVDEVTSGLSDMTNKFKTSGSANDFTVFAADSGVVVLYTYVSALGKNVGFKRNADGTITGFID